MINKITGNKNIIKVLFSIIEDIMKSEEGIKIVVIYNTVPHVEIHMETEVEQSVWNRLVSMERQSLKAGGKEVLEEIEYKFKDKSDSPIIRIDESEWEKFKKEMGGK